MIAAPYPHEQTAGTSGRPKPGDEPHNFVADHFDPGYRPVCRICGRTALGHPYVTPPRRPR